MKLPKDYEASMMELLGDDYREYLDVFHRPVHQGLRVNTNKITVEAFQKLAPFSMRKVPWISNGFYYSEGDQPSKHPLYYAGLYYLQEPSAMTPASRLPVSPGDKVLDLCAAPGGKATEIGAKLAGTGMLLANDISNSRSKGLLKNLELMGINNSCVTSEDPKKLEPYFIEYFDKIIIDAPCSGEGMFHKEMQMIDYWVQKGPSYYSGIQRELIMTAAHMLKPGGMMLYSTCTFSQSENEGTIDFLLSQKPEFQLVEVEPYMGFEKGRNSLDKCVRIFPHKMEGEGHFLALLKKNGHCHSQPQCKRLQEEQNLDKSIKLPQEAMVFLEKVSLDFQNGSFTMVEDRVYWLSNQLRIPRKLRYLRTGLYLGDCRKKRFEPSQALAMSLKKQEYADCIDLKQEDPRVIKYLKGETVSLEEGEIQSDNGWRLICVEGYPLGWAKQMGYTLKNKYYPGWRWQ